MELFELMFWLVAIAATLGGIAGTAVIIVSKARVSLIWPLLELAAGAGLVCLLLALGARAERNLFVLVLFLTIPLVGGRGLRLGSQELLKSLKPPANAD